jgi:ATP-dependent Clp endopeptidase proteolytic subunit ClpP
MKTGVQCTVTDNGELLLYGVVGDSWDELDAKTVIAQIEGLGDVDTLTIRINSGGGFVFEGLAIFNYLNAHPAKKVVYIDGLAASMASVLAMVGDEVIIPENAMIMIHNPWDVAVGDSEELRKSADKLDKIKEAIVGIYVARSGKSQEEIETMMNEETWMTGSEAVEFGFADMLTDPVQVAASVDVSMFSKAPTNKLLMRAQTETSTREGNDMPETQNKPDASQAANEDALRAEGAVAERKRSTDIRAAVASAGLSMDYADELIDSGVDIDGARAQVIDKLAEERSKQPDTQAQHSVAPGQDQSEKMVEGATAALMDRCGYERMEGGNEFRGLTLRELARAMLDAHNVPSRGLRPMDMVKMAMTHSSGDFVNILANVAYKSMMKGYEEAEETFQRWTVPGTLTDFKVHNRVDLNTFPSLREVRPGAEYKYITIGDRGVTLKLATYGEMFSINRQAIINDDMNVFTKVPQKMGRASIRTVGDLAYAVLTDNAALADGIALFHANHGNLAGAGAAPSTTTISAGRTAMGKQKDPDQNAHALNIRPSYILGPLELQDSLQTLMSAEWNPAEGGTTSFREPNVVRNMAEVVTDARLSTDSATAWYLAANPNVYDTVEVSYLDGVQTPVLEQREGWNIDGVEFKIRMDAAVTPLDFRGLYKNAGA